MNENGNAPQAESLDLGQKMKTTVLKPAGAQVARLPDGGAILELDLGPLEAVSLVLTEEGRAAIVQALTGGIHIAGPGDVI